jgi:foldase protein PrsA
VRSGVIRRLALLGLLLLSLFILVGCGDDLPQGAIAQVGQKLVSQEEFDGLKAAYEAAGRAPDKDRQPEEYESFEQALAEYLVTLEILRQEAPSLKVSVSEADVRSELEQIGQMFQGDDKFEQALEAQGLTLEQLTQSIREQLLIKKMKAVVTGDVTVTEQEAETYYEEHKDEYVEQESRDVRHILVSPFKTTVDGVVATTATQDQWDAAEAEAEKARSELQNGASFITVAEKYSDDEATKNSGGKLGAVTRGLMVPAFEVVVFNLQIGELSQPVKTPYGYHVIEVTDITPERQLSYDQVKDNITAALLEQKQAATWQKWLTLAQARLGVEYLAGYRPPSEQSGGSAARSAEGAESSTETSGE